MWQKSGSSARLGNQSANIYIGQLNGERSKGHSDWRMPTLEELASLLANERKSGVHLAPVFDYKQIRCWTIDPCDPTASHLRGAWIIDFQNGEVSQAFFSWRGGRANYSKNYENYVKAVRSAKEIKTTPEKTKTEAERPPVEKETPKVASIPKDVSDAGVSLRENPLKITETKVTDMLLEYDFFEISKNTRGSFVNDFVDNNDGTVIDKVTGLMWQKSGSSSSSHMDAKRYIKRLNKERFAGHSDWRIPTLEELASLLEKRSKSGVHIDPIFDHKRSICWTVDKTNATGTRWLGLWIVDFKQGQILQALFNNSGQYSHVNHPYNINALNYVKAVRSFG
jgi:hypothetical protein